MSAAPAGAAPAPAPLVELRGVHKRFGARPVLRGVDLAVRRGEVRFVIGTSGVGKSVTIKLLVGLLAPDAGELWFDGQRLDRLPPAAWPQVRRRVGMVFQSSTLLDAMTLAENVALPLRKHRGLRHAAAVAEGRARLAELHLEAFADRHPAELSDGVRKRAAIARALALAPEVLLLDEPTTGLDPVSARRVDRLIRALADQRGVTVVVVSHDLPSIFGVADRVAMLYQGQVRADGTPAELRASADPVVQQLVRGDAEGPLETPGF